jgi:hypothetical protein
MDQLTSLTTIVIGSGGQPCISVVRSRLAPEGLRGAPFVNLSNDWLVRRPSSPAAEEHPPDGTRRLLMSMSMSILIHSMSGVDL